MDRVKVNCDNQFYLNDKQIEDLKRILGDIKEKPCYITISCEELANKMKGVFNYERNKRT